jgi:steroid delta-isomerase-like uncharacterized protein
MIHRHLTGAVRLIAVMALCASALCLHPGSASAQQGSSGASSLDANKALVRRFIDEVHNKGNFALFNELFAANYVNHSAPVGESDRAARERSIRTYREAAPDLRVTIDDMIAEGDKVALRWTTKGTARGQLRTPLGMAPPVDRPISVPGVNIFRIVNGQIAEEWIVWDTLSWAQQLGLDLRRQ